MATKQSESNLRSLFPEHSSEVYSHGLEKTYAIQHIDLRTIRPLQMQPTEKSSKPKPIEVSIQEAKIERSLPFGEYFEEAIHPFWQEEPIEVLGFSSHLETRLKEKGDLRLRDIASISPQELLYVKGIGQGHVEELFSKLNRYLENKPKDETGYLDLIAWIRSLIGDLPRKMAIELLEAHHLANDIMLVESSTFEKREKIKAFHLLPQAIQLCREPSRRARWSRQMQQITHAFLAPWIQRRGGIASQEELIERLENVSLQNTYVRPCLHLFDQIFSPHLSVLATHLIHLGDSIYTADEQGRNSYFRLLKQLKSYFYKPNITYCFSHLVQLMQRESALKWEELDVKLLKKICRLNPGFYLEKDSCGEQMVSLVF